MESFAFDLDVTARATEILADTTTTLPKQKVKRIKNLEILLRCCCFFKKFFLAPLKDEV